MRPSHPIPLNCQYQPSRPIQSSQQQALRARQPSRRKRLSTLSVSSVFTRSAMPSKFNIVRASLYGKCAPCLRACHRNQFRHSSRRSGLDHNMSSHRSSLPESTCHYRSKYMRSFRPMICSRSSTTQLVSSHSHYSSAVRAC